MVRLPQRQHRHLQIYLVMKSLSGLLLTVVLLILVRNFQTFSSSGHIVMVQEHGIYQLQVQNFMVASLEAIGLILGNS